MFVELITLYSYILYCMQHHAVVICNCMHIQNIFVLQKLVAHIFVL